jgi:hypothetical protein
MKEAEIEALRQIKNLPEPRHLFVVPDPLALDQLIQEGCLTCEHEQRNDEGLIQVAMGLQLTPKGESLLRLGADWQQLAWRGSLAGASFAAMSVVILYIG